MTTQAYTPEMAERVTELFKDGSSITKVAAVKLGICRATYYEWKNIHPEFKKAAELGEQISESFHEEKLHAGADGEIEGFNASARIFIMKSRFKEVYGENQGNKSLETSLIEKLLELK